MDSTPEDISENNSSKKPKPKYYNVNDWKKEIGDNEMEAIRFAAKKNNLPEKDVLEFIFHYYGTIHHLSRFNGTSKNVIRTVMCACDYIGFIRTMTYTQSMYENIKGYTAGKFKKVHSNIAGAVRRNREIMMKYENKRTPKPPRGE